MKKYLFAIMTFLTFIFTNCTDEDGKKDPIHTRNGFKLSYSISDPTSVLTRSAIDFEEGEDRINSFYVLFFENTTGGTGRFIDAIDVMASYDVSLGSSGILDIPFPEGSILDNSKEYKLLLCANIKEYADIAGIEDLKTLCSGEMERDVLGLLMKISGVAPGKSPEDEQDDDSNLMDMYNLPMSAGFVKKANEGTVEVELSRAVSRFDVYCKASGYTLVSASIWNAYTVSYIWEGSFTDFTGARTERYYGVRADSNKEIIGSLYAFENHVTNPAQKDKVTTCLIVGLRNEETGDIEYFRTNVNVSAIYGHQLRRNHVYSTIVMSVNSKGDETERGAYENGELLLDIDVSNWLVDDSGILQIEGQNILAIPTNQIKLFSQGDKREYYIYTIGNGVPTIGDSHLPGHMFATLKLAPGYNENLNFKASILTLESTAGTADISDGYFVKIDFGTMNARMTVVQEGIVGDYVNLSKYELPPFSWSAGGESEDIEVISSGDWMAEIAYGDHFSFSADGLETEISGHSEETFKVYTLQNNPLQESRYCFVKIYLSEKPEISRIIVLAQEAWDGKYLSLSPASVSPVPVQGGASEVITIQASGPWTASMTVEGNEAWFGNSENQGKEISGNGDGSFTVHFAPLTQEQVTPWAIVTVQLNNSQLQESIVVSQTPISETGILIWTNTLGVSTLALYGTDFCNTSGSAAVNKTNTENHTKYVYDLGQFMRNTQLFGSEPNSKVYVPGGFRFAQGTVAYREAASIWQFVSYPTKNSDEMKAVKQAMVEDSGKFLLFSHKDAAVSNTLTNFGMSTGYTVKNITAKQAAGGYTLVKTEKELNKPMIKYLIETGPFGNISNIDNIKINALAEATVRGFSVWPDTFTPIIVNTATGYCVFGVDLTQRFIWISDPSIFGSDTSGAANYGNYVESKQENAILIKNFIAFIAEAIQKGSTFLDNYR